MTKYRYLIKKLIYRYIKFSIIGTFVWIINTLLYFFMFQYIGIYAWFVTIFTGLIEFALITIFNLTKHGKMFESCKEHE